MNELMDGLKERLYMNGQMNGSVNELMGKMSDGWFESCKKATQLDVKLYHRGSL